MPQFKMDYTKPIKARSIITEKRTIINKIIAWELDKEYYDGNRLNGYGGFKYDGRWKKVLPKFIKRYKLKAGSKVLDIGCKKGFLLHDLKELVPGIKIYGIDDHSYPLKKSMKSVRSNLKLSKYHEIPFKNNFFDAVFAIHCIYRLNFRDMITAIKEIQRVSKKNSFMTLGAYHDEKGQMLFNKWGILATCFYHVNDWKKIFKYLKYKGDYEFTTPESLGLK